jgi:glyoxylase-like metal-dependent hydrolase (beta-lactamase superfamily II)
VNVVPFYDPRTFTLTYVVYEGNDAVVIDPVLDYDPLSSTTSTESLQKVTAFLEEKKLKLHLVFETHAHADHLSGSQYLKKRYGANVVIGHRITEVQSTFKGVFNLDPDFPVDGRQFDKLVKEGDTLRAGALEIGVIETPGHTPACVTYKIDDAVFTGDALFTEDYGTGRCDFPMGSADALYTSVHEKLYGLPDATRVFVGHDYQPDGREVRWETTIGLSKSANVQLKKETPKSDFVRFRNERDARLAAPKLLYPSVQINIDAGRLPKPAANGTRYLHIPLDRGRPVEEA